MAGKTAAASIQIVNVDLAPERQRILREKLEEFFQGLSGKSRVKKGLIYVVNQNGDRLDKVALANPQADALFSGFNYDEHVSDEYKKEQLVNSAIDASEISPALRYPAIGEYEKLATRGYLRHRKVFLVGDVAEKLKSALKAALPVEVSFFTSGERNEVSAPLKISSPEAILPHREGAQSTPQGVVVSQINSVSIAGVAFAGIVNMPERDNRFVLEDQTLFDTTGKLFTMEGLKEVLLRESLQEEKLTFVRAKKVFIVMEPDLEHVVSDRLTFDKMEKLFRHHSVAEALAALDNGASQELVDYFQAAGFEVIFEAFSQEERDRLMLALLGEQLGGYLTKEIDSQKNNLAALDDTDLKEIWNSLPESVLDTVLEQLHAKSAEKYLTMVPLQIRENVMGEFLSDAKQVAGAWEGMEEKERKEILNAQAPQILAHIYLVDTPLFKNKFPTLKFEFAKNYNSSAFEGMDQERRQATFGLLEKGVREAKPPQGLLARQLTGPEQTRAVAAYVARNSEMFINALEPLSRKNLWHRVGGTFHTQIAAGLHFLDKVEILNGNREGAAALVFNDPATVALLKTPAHEASAGKVFLILKKNNKVESKTALLRKILAGEAKATPWQQVFSGFFAQPENAAAAAKVTERLEDTFSFTFDSLICTHGDYELLQDKEPLRGAAVVFLDDLVDDSLYALFQRGEVSREEYDAFNKEAEQQIVALRKKIADQEKEDPVAVYLLESMHMLNEMGNRAMKGTLDADAVDQIDERRAVRERMITALTEHLEKVDQFLAKAAAQQEQLAGKIAKAEAMANGQREAYQGAHGRAREAADAVRKTVTQREKMLAHKKNVALTQKELSLQFFYIIQPLILNKVRSGKSLLRRLLGRFGLFRQEAESLARRIIFKFSDTEIANILRHRIVFCSKDQILIQFVLTCLRIDGLQDSLFTIATPETLPQGGVDILFYGPGYDAADFKGLVKRKNVVPFADQEFFDRLTANEQLKATTKSALAKLEQEIAQKKQPLEKLVGAAKAEQTKLGQVEAALATLGAEAATLAATVEQQQERRHHFQGELQLLETRFSEVDTKFNFIRETLSGLGSEEGGEAASLLSSGRESLGEQLQGELLALNKELARMMFIKGVKDAGDQISQGTQQEIMARMDQREVLPSSALPLKRLLIADDGSNFSTNVKRVLGSVGRAYFRLGEGALEEVTLKRLASRAEDPEQAAYPFIALVADGRGDDFAELKNLVKKLRTAMPEAYQMVFAPFGEIWTLPPEGEICRNLRSLKDNSCLVNAGIADYTDPQRLVRLLGEKAPRPRAAAAS